MAELTIKLVPTNRLEMLGGVQFRVYEGVTDSGIKLEMMGLFRIEDAMDRAKFTAAVCASKPGDPAPVRLIPTESLISP